MHMMMMMMEEPVWAKNQMCIYFDQVDKDHDPMAQYKRPTIAEREDEYRARRRMQAISPERFDHFADEL
ncbi:hypothetical protein Avbf_03183 [Armadillidium vulgare]|nr:hypothetical protein Avbf_03183 [Armadillidium vulgare]